MRPDELMKSAAVASSSPVATGVVDNATTVCLYGRVRPWIVLAPNKWWLRKLSVTFIFSWGSTKDSQLLTLIFDHVNRLTKDKNCIILITFLLKILLIGTFSVCNTQFTILQTYKKFLHFVFTAQRYGTIAAYAYAMVMCVCVTRRYCVKTAEQIQFVFGTGVVL